MRSIPNRAFWRAIHSLAHPLTIMAVLVLLLNHHWLRWANPTWLTGKLGDFAWLVFAPLIAAVIFSLIFPRGIRKREQVVGLTAFVAVGLWFALAKTTIPIHSLTVEIWHRIIGWDGILLMDATDLLTLPALLVGWWIWAHVDSTPLSLRPLAYAVFGLGILLTLANSPGATDLGIQCVIENPKGLLAIPGGYPVRIIYISEDTGLTWKRAVNLDKDAGAFECRWKDNFVVSNPENPLIQYHFQQAQAIDRSDDGGQSWILAIDLSELNQEVRRFYHGLNHDDRALGGMVANPGPFDAIFESRSGNLIVAMGSDGILLHTSDGNWRWIEVGPYHLVSIDHPEMLPALLNAEIGLAILLGVLALASLLPTAPLGEITGCFLYLSWLCWIISVFLPFPKWPTGDFLAPGIVTFLTTPFAIIIGIVFLVVIAVEMALGRLSPKRKGYRVMLVIIAILVFLLPYILWAHGTIPDHTTATLFSLFLVATTLIGGNTYLKLLQGLKKKSVDEVPDENLPAPA